MLKIVLIIGVISIIISGIFIGAWTTGEQQRANVHSETEDHRHFRTKMAMVTGAVGLIAFGIAGVIYYL